MITLGLEELSDSRLPLTLQTRIKDEMDIPRQRTIKVGTSTIGLISLDAALKRVSGQKLSDEEVADLLFDAVRRHNYIPPGSEKLYKDALLREYKQYDQSEDRGGSLTIRILGRPCVSCKKLKTMIIDILQEMQLAADMEDIQDLDEIWRYGVTRTPALIINGKIKSAGTHPPRSQVEQWIREATTQQ